MPLLRRTLSSALVAVVMAASATVLAPSASADLTPTTRITPAAGCHDLVPGFNGVKVALVQRRLGMPASTWETMDATTVSKVRAFQSVRPLRRDGVVDRATWQALGIAQDFCLDRFQHAPRLPFGASALERREVFVRAAEEYLGDEYVWGGVGAPGQGVDCSGLVLQALYAAGVDPQPISVDLHVQPAYRTSKELYALPGWSKHPLSQVRRGDLVFYTKNSTGVINHVALYLGDGVLLEAKDADVHRVRLSRTLPEQTVVQTVVRPFTPAPTAADLRYVDALYVDYLGRRADPSGLATWGGQLAEGQTSRYELSRRLAGTDEYLGHVVDTAYRTVLRREADPAGRAAWVAELRRGMSPAQLYTGFYASAEHHARSGATASDPAPWVRAMYAEVLGRPASTQEVEHWAGVARTAGRPAVAAGFHGSPESLLRRTHALYARFLGRPADPAGLASWPAVVSRDGDIALAAHLTSSQEYVDRAQAR